MLSENASLVRAHTTQLLSEQVAVWTGLAACWAWCTQRNTKTISLLVSHMDDLSGAVASVLGPDKIDLLKRHKKFKHRGITTFVLADTASEHAPDGMLLALGIAPHRLSEMTNHPGVQASVFIPRTEEDLVTYLGLYPTSGKVEPRYVEDASRPTMSPEHQARVSWYETHYEVIAYEHLRPGNKRVIGIGQPQTCRYCGRERPATSFGKEAHALSLLIGNRTLIDALECDACNEHFGNFIEDHFAKWTHPFRTLGRIKGRKSIPAWKSSDGHSRVEAPDASNLRMWFPAGDSRRQLNKEENSLHLSLERQPYVPMGVFKALVKMALAVMPLDVDTHCEHLKQWLLDPAHSFESYPYGPLNIYFQQFSGPAPTEDLAYWLLRRRTDSEIAPYLTFVLQFSNLTLQIILPMHEQDKAFMEGKSFELGWFPSLSGIESHEKAFGATVRKILDMSSTSLVKGDQERMKFHYQSVEEFSQLGTDSSCNSSTPDTSKATSRSTP